MTDKELLEYAAKAAGYEYDEYYEGIGLVNWIENDLQDSWNPLTDDGDALRLAVKLNMDVEVLLEQSFTIVHTDRTVSQTEHHDNDPYAATRRAIVRAASEIGKEMK